MIKLTIHFSATLDIVGRMLMGLKFAISVLAPDLKIGVTIATFHCDGTVH